MKLQGLPYVGSYSEQDHISYRFSVFTFNDHTKQPLKFDRLKYGASMLFFFYSYNLKFIIYGVTQIH